jgi:hypothetical protein
MFVYSIIPMMSQFSYFRIWAGAVTEYVLSQLNGTLFSNQWDQSQEVIFQFRVFKWQKDVFSFMLAIYLSTATLL